MHKIATILALLLVNSTPSLAQSASSPQGMNEKGIALEKSGEPCGALKMYLQSAQLGYAAAKNNVARIMISGACPPKEVASGVQWLESAAEDGLQQAQHVLASIYLEGSLVPQSLHKSYYWSKRVFRVDRSLSHDQIEIVRMNEQIEDFIARKKLRQAYDLAASAAERFGYDRAIPGIGHAYLTYNWDVGCEAFGAVPGLEKIKTDSVKYCRRTNFRENICLGYYQSIFDTYMPKLFAHAPCRGQILVK